MKIKADVSHWVTRAVIGLNLCPFAKSVYVKGKIHYSVSDATTPDAALQSLEQELQNLINFGNDSNDTTLLILPNVLQDYFDYNNFIFFAELLLEKMGLSGVIQIATFHPNYQFKGTKKNDIDNYTNRSPYPILHLLQEASISRVVDAFPQTADIYQRNIYTLRCLGIDGWTEWMQREI
ncbi:DUF1415 domain-containing protein [Candidatus Pandoraea novymonadis]|uniref:Peptidase n=1 Tax=Candidatus Pandoraea novymonadis TaxID=1808959 RepID=A0ABX5FEN8_9BURK|nr:DUF1415 domain-containing protein [Candidatus Pandoraea novymonadis]PSB92099.1 hypothetical protein BZL35_00326 [Candidatus Pandoraea novymonadis]